MKMPIYESGIFDYDECISKQSVDDFKKIII